MIGRGSGSSRSITILSDSQTTLKALETSEVKSKQVWECRESLMKAAELNTVLLVWGPGHTGVHSNERADELAKGAAMSPIGTEPCIEISYGYI